jgi:hypothetical protein
VRVELVSSRQGLAVGAIQLPVLDEVGQIVNSQALAAALGSIRKAFDQYIEQGPYILIRRFVGRPPLMLLRQNPFCSGD